jgi:threonylcarbamoyladenosine tRNA methylthiotransferase MtaB
VTAVKEAQPNTIIGADVIVGFPGETDADFDQTRRLAESGLIDYLHVFSYSDRPGTPASLMSGKISPEVSKVRNLQLTAISETLRMQACRRQIGETLEVIAEHKRNSDESFWSVADNYVKVKLPGWVEGGKGLVKVRVTRAFDDYVEGELLSHQARAVS